MIKQFANWQGKVSVNGVEYQNIASVPETALTNSTVITLLPLHTKEVPDKQAIKEGTDKAVHVITVRQYMTKPASPEFNFMAQWNNNIPMPMRTMTGTIEKETKGMVYMKLHGYGKPAVYCVRCGKELTNPVSRYYGLGTECIQKVGIFRSIEDIDGIREDLAKITWEGWIIKSAITEDTIKEV